MIFVSIGIFCYKCHRYTFVNKSGHFLICMEKILAHPCHNWKIIWRLQIGTRCLMQQSAAILGLICILRRPMAAGAVTNGSWAPLGLYFQLPAGKNTLHDLAGVGANSHSLISFGKWMRSELLQKEWRTTISFNSGLDYMGDIWALAYCLMP